MPLTPDHGYPMLVAIASAVAIQYAGFKVGAARRKYNVKYPTLYLRSFAVNVLLLVGVFQPSVWETQGN